MVLENVEKYCDVRLPGNQDYYKALSWRVKTLLRRGKERYVRILTDDAKGHFNPKDFQLVYLALRKVRSKHPS